MLLLVMLPITAIFLSWVSVDFSLWAHLLDTQVSHWVFNTLVLMVLVGIQATMLGVLFAWLFVFFDFMGRRWLEWAIVLPLTMPAYVYAFIFLGLWGYTGPVQGFLRENNIAFLQFSDIRNLWTLSWVLSFCLYPYIYLLAREAFLGLTKNTEDAARMLGAGRFDLNVKLRLGMIKVPVVAGCTLVMIETLADFGAVAMFNIDTLTVGVYKVWFEFFDLKTACQLASILLVFVFGFLLIRSGKKRDTYFQADRHIARKQLSGLQNYAVFAAIFIFLVLFFLLPVGQLIFWIIKTQFAINENFIQLMMNSFKLATFSAIFIVIVSLLLVNLERFSLSAVAGKILSAVRLGYAIPGAVLAVGLVMVFGQFEQLLSGIKAALGLGGQQIFLGGLSLLFVTYMVRFLTVGLNPVGSSMAQISTPIIEAARIFERSKAAMYLLVKWPLLKKGLLTAGILVFVEVIKEMPATLLLRPFGFDTLAVKVFELTSEGEYELAAMPALMIMLLCVIPVALTILKTNQTNKKQKTYYV